MHRITFLTSLIFALSCLLGCGGGDPSWDLSRNAATNIEPDIGVYSFNETGCFEVAQESGSAKKILRFSADCFRYDSISIESGAFYKEHGSIGGTNCPTDSYAISGAFQTQTRAEGTIKYARDCSFTRAAAFVADKH